MLHRWHCLYGIQHSRQFVETSRRRRGLRSVRQFISAHYAPGYQSFRSGGVIAVRLTNAGDVGYRPPLGAGAWEPMLARRVRHCLGNRLRALGPRRYCAAKRQGLPGWLRIRTAGVRAETACVRGAGGPFHAGHHGRGPALNAAGDTDNRRWTVQAGAGQPLATQPSDCTFFDGIAPDACWWWCFT